MSDGFDFLRKPNGRNLSNGWFLTFFPEIFRMEFFDSCPSQLGCAHRQQCLLVVANRILATLIRSRDSDVFQLQLGNAILFRSLGNCVFLLILLEVQNFLNSLSVYSVSVSDRSIHGVP